MRLHLVFFKLHSDASDRIDDLMAGLAHPGVEVLRPADETAAKAWDTAVLIRGTVNEVDGLVAWVRKATESLPVEVTKGWSFTPEAT